MKVQLTCTLDQYHHLGVAANGTKRGAKTVKVDRQALMNLIIDHGRVLARVRPEELEQADG